MWNNVLSHIVKYCSFVAMWNEIRLLTFAKQIFHSEAISHGEAIFHSPKANFVEKSTHCLGRQMCAFFWWGMVDSDHRSQWQQIYSLPPLAAREFPHMELVNGVEPSTCWLQISCSAIEPHQHFYPPPQTATAFAIALPLRRILVYHKGFFLSIVFWKYF